ncbi:MAG: hypothetical protein PHQ75_07870 [Thermoguttaceae bacterium]|nr:hypothetical protein [Thermoguttaceae bacterium]
MRSIFETMCYIGLYLSVCVIGVFVSGIQGCAPAPVMGTVSGTAVCQGKPLTCGEVLFSTPDHRQSSSGAVDEKGDYVLRKPLQAGVYQVAWTPPEPGIDPKTELPLKPVKSPVNIKRQNTETTDLTFEIKEGKNTANFEF